MRVETQVERDEDSTPVRRRFVTPAGALTERMRCHRPGMVWGIVPNPHWEERLVKDERDLEALAFLLPAPTPDMSNGCVAGRKEDRVVRKEEDESHQEPPPRSSFLPPSLLLPSL